MSFKSACRPSTSGFPRSIDRSIDEAARAERARQAQGEAYQVHYLHQIDDPNNALAAASLPRHDIAITRHMVAAVHDGRFVVCGWATLVRPEAQADSAGR